MPFGAVERETLIDEIEDLEVLRERLKAAERVCVLFAWEAAPDRKWARGRLQFDTWSAWLEVAGGTAASNVDANPELRDALRDADRRDAEYRKQAKA